MDHEGAEPNCRNGGFRDLVAGTDAPERSEGSGLGRKKARQSQGHVSIASRTPDAWRTMPNPTEKFADGIFASRDPVRTTERSEYFARE